MRGELRAIRTVLRNAVRSRLARRAVARELARRPPVPAGHFVVAVHFPDFPVNAYQIRQWYRPLEVVADELPVVVISRYASTTRLLLAECPVPVVHAPRIADVETVLTEHPIRAVLYVNQNVRNFSVLRYRDPVHVFCSHGESEKDYMASGQLKAYDRTFVAGPAAAARLQVLHEYDVAARTVQIGRPQIDHLPAGPIIHDGRPTVLYAPTWEGDRPSMAYGSVATHGPAMVDAILADPRYRLVVRPHPRTGTSDHAATAALHRIRRAVERANRAGGKHLLDTTTDFGWQLGVCDVCITDVSAVAYDWLATGKPLVLTEPADPAAVTDGIRLPSVVPGLPAQAAGDVVPLLDRALSDPLPAEQTDLIAEFFGDVSPGASTRRFVAALRQVVSEREALLRQTR